jgi:hypothetical protein
MLKFQGAEADRLRAWLTVHTTELEAGSEDESHASEVGVQHAPAKRGGGLGDLLRAANSTGRALQRSLLNRIMS